ncbi:MAG TPA: hypothetical protein VK569_03395 [Bacteroidota bacterium]|nr:hypothetical protein [Bacteroidota bacterium]
MKKACLNEPEPTFIQSTPRPGEKQQNSLDFTGELSGFAYLDHGLALTGKIIYIRRVLLHAQDFPELPSSNSISYLFSPSTMRRLS